MMCRAIFPNIVAFLDLEVTLNGMLLKRLFHRLIKLEYHSIVGLKPSSKSTWGL